jgi:hypothetical protein
MLVDEVTSILTDRQLQKRVDSFAQNPETRQTRTFIKSGKT